MKFSTTTRIVTNNPVDMLTQVIAREFKIVSESIAGSGQTLSATGVCATFGSGTRQDRTEVKFRKTADGYMVYAETDLRPAWLVWLVFILITFGTSFIYFVLMYLYQHHLVRRVIEGAMRSIKDEMESASHVAQLPQISDFPASEPVDDTLEMSEVPADVAPEINREDVAATMLDEAREMLANGDKQGARQMLAILASDYSDTKSGVTASRSIKRPAKA